MKHIFSIWCMMGIVHIDDALHEEVRKAGRVMCRSINAQAEFWMRIGMIAESNPTLTFHQIVQRQFAEAGLDATVQIRALS